MLKNKRLRQLIPALMLVLGGAAQALDSSSTKDPTLPPAAWLAAQPKGPSTPNSPLPPSDGTTPGVQVMIIGKSRRMALIDGQVVKVGDMINGAKVVAIKSGEVIVEDESKTLKMTPGVEKKVIRQVTAKKTSRVTRGNMTAADGSRTGIGGSQ